jgi:quinoprotein glucose dehydrogenase
MNWGSVTVDPGRQMAFFLSNRMVNYIRLLRRTDSGAQGVKASSEVNTGAKVAQEGTPYVADISQLFMSPLGVPCQAPPYGTISAVDLSTGKLVWNRPLGSARDTGPLGLRSGLPFTVGTPLFGGAISTAGGLVFVGASSDHAFRAFDSGTGRLLFEADLPGSSSARPMTFRSDKSGRQIVVIASEKAQSYGAITAFALPNRRYGTP